MDTWFGGHDFEARTLISCEMAMCILFGGCMPCFGIKSCFIGLTTQRDVTVGV